MPVPRGISVDRTCKTHGLTEFGPSGRRFRCRKCHLVRGEADRRARGQRVFVPCPAAHTPTLAELHWAAGFLEGEGCFSVASRKGARVQAAQVNRTPLEKLAGMFGGRLRDSKADRNPRWQAITWWTVNGSRALGVMQTLYPLLTEKRQAEIRNVIGRTK